MSPYVGLDIGVFVLGLLALALLAWRLWGQVKGLGRSVSAAAGRIGDAQAQLDRAAAERGAAPSRRVSSEGLAPSEGARRG